MTSLCLSHPPKPPPTHLATFAISEVPSPCAFIFTQHRQHGDALNLTLASGEPFDRERYEANIGAGPAGMLNGCALVAAHGAPGALSQLVAGGVWAPPDDRRGESHWRIVRTFFAIHPPPPIRAVEVAQGRPRTGIVPHLDRLGLWTRQASSRRRGRARGLQARPQSSDPSSVTASRLSYQQC